MRSKNDCDVKREFWWRVRARARLSSLFGRDRERRDGGFERNARKRTGRAGGRDGWMVARALLSAFSMRAMCTKVLLSLLFGATNIPPRWIDAKDSPPRLFLSLSLCSPSRSITTTITAERHVRRRRLGHRPVEKDEKSVQKVLLPWRRPRTTPRIENRQIGRPVLRAPKTSIPQRSRPQTVGAGEEAPQSEERGSRDGQARNDQNALEKHDHSAGDDWRHRRRV